jgi:glycogen debranching enzyme
VFDRTGDRNLLDDCDAPLAKALSWIDKYGDFDGDGFVEYLSRSKDGIQNQGWKDSGDAIRAADGTIVNAPIALCETQGQVYAAWRSAADLYDVRGQPDRAQVLRQKADELYDRFNDRFWMEDEGFYCLGLDGNKQQIRSIASNAGQLLWSGIVPQDRAKQLVDRLFQPDLHLTHLNVGDATVDLHFWRENEQTHWEVVDRVGELEEVGLLPPPLGTTVSTQVI